MVRDYQMSFWSNVLIVKNTHDVRAYFAEQFNFNLFFSLKLDFISEERESVKNFKGLNNHAFKV